ncbi:MAG: hypothetical protein ACI4MS_04650 [Candidatus Coproplasma sp.]
MSNNRFEYSYSAPTEEERREIDSIRNSYQPRSKEISKLDRLRRLDKKVKNTAMAVSLTLGLAGVLIFGLGMSLALEWGYYLAGSLTAVAGCIPMGISYPVYNKVLAHQKKKYGEEILKLSEELLNQTKDDIE